MNKPLWSARRVLAAVVLFGWAGFFWWLWLSDRYFLFVGARTSWVVPAGAVLLSVAATGRILTARVDHAHPLRGTEAIAASLLLLPVSATLALPPAALGSLAAGNRGNFVDAGIEVSAEEIATGDLTWLKVAAGSASPEQHQALLTRVGEPLTLTGFVTKGGWSPAGGFVLNRFAITCCVADALVMKLRVEGGGDLVNVDDWVTVSGRLVPFKDNKVLFESDSVRPIPQPKRPYIRT